MLKKLFKIVGIGVGALVGLIVLLAVIGAIVGDGAPAVQDTPVAAAAPAPKAPPVPVQQSAPEPKAITITAKQLYDAYDSNEVRADQAYKGRVLIVKGKVDRIASDMFNNPVVHLSASRFLSVAANDIPIESAAKLNKGQHIAVRCIGGGEVMGSPMLKDCVIE